MNTVKSAKPFTLMVASNNECFRIGSSEMLRKSNLISMAGSAKDIVTAIELLEKKMCHVALIDEKLRGLHGKCSAYIIREKFPEIKVIAVGERYTEERIADLKKWGVKGCLHLRTSKKEIEEAILTDEVIYISPEIKNNGKENKELIVLNELFTPREQEVFWLLIKGKNAKEIKEEIFVSTDTVYHYREKILSKSKCANEVQLLVWALRNKLTGIPEM